MIELGFGWVAGCDGGDDWAAFVANPQRWSREELEDRYQQNSAIAPDRRRAILLAALAAMEPAWLTPYSSRGPAATGCGTAA